MVSKRKKSVVCANAFSYNTCTGASIPCPIQTAHLITHKCYNDPLLYFCDIILKEKKTTQVHKGSVRAVIVLILCYISFAPT